MLLLRDNFIVIFFAVALAATMLSGNLLTFRNVSNLFQQASIVGIVAVGMTFVILTANIDLSVGSMVALGGMCVSLLMQAGWPPLLAVAAAIMVGGLTGGLMGAIAAYAAVPNFIVTLAGLVSIRGVTYLLSDGVPVGGFPPASGRSGTMPLPLFPGSGLTFPILGVVFLVICGLAALILRYTAFGENVYTIGGNAEAARLSGLPVQLIVTIVFATSGLLAALAGVLLTARPRIGQPTAAQGPELDAIAAVVLGGTRFFGGRGGIIGTIFCRHPLAGSSQHLQSFLAWARSTR